MREITDLDRLAIADYNRQRRFMSEMLSLLERTLDPLLEELTDVGDNPTDEELEALAGRWGELRDLLTEGGYWQFEASVRPRRIRRGLEERKAQ